MRTLTKDEAIEQHRKLWRWIADETKKQGRIVDKNEYFEAMGIDEKDIPFNDCYCCEFDIQARDVESFCGHCEKCPLDWGAGYEPGYIFALCSEIKYTSNSIEAGYFEQWQDTRSFKVAAFLARIIAELPEKEE